MAPAVEDKKPAALQAKRTSPTDIICIDLTEDSDDSFPAIPAFGSTRKKLKMESSASAINYEDVQVIDAPVAVVTAAASASSRDTDIELVGTVNEQKLPHMRPHCLEERFDANSSAKSMKYCSLCYCYVCDIPAQDCQNWTSHCMATDRGHRAYYWRSLRQQSKRNKQGTSTRTPTNAYRRSANTAATRATQAFQDARRNSVCAQCGWKGYKAPKTYPGTHDWCPDCGRMATTKDHGKPTNIPPQSVPYTPNPTEDILLGTRHIPFTIHARDPREMEKYAANWRDHPRWKYSAKEMQQEVFNHRFGARPALHMICASLPIVQDIPKDAPEGDRYGICKDVNRSELDSLQLFSRNHRILLTMLHACAHDSCRVHYSLQATWNKESQQGNLSVTVYLRPTTQGQKEPMAMAPFLGAWYNIFPFSLEEIVGTQAIERADFVGRHASLPYPPFYWDYDNAHEKARDLLPLKEKQRDDLQEAVQQHEATQSIASSSTLKGNGGISPKPAETDMRSIWKRYYQENLPCLDNCSYSYFCEGVVSRHRNMRQADPSRIAFSAYDEGNVNPIWNQDTFLTLADTSAAESMVQTDTILQGKGEPIPDFLERLENLGHDCSTMDHLEGLNLELLPFQKQSVQWAVERETTSGGIRSFTWAKLPNVDMYYNPGTRKIVSEKPKLVRGGLLCQQMGLGKTVVSLALILKNPAPAMPSSGSPASSISQVVPPSSDGMTAPFWDPTVQSEGSAGSIVCRGTLVVCTVSLVGQWIEEAKSKLTDPGLVYSYHGGGRNRNAQVLAKNSIVVTTYETLSSDRTYHRDKSSDPDSYCAPCDRVRWWRVICDESHCLRGGSGKLDAVNSLTAENKWLVTGTPLCSELSDLKKQLSFLGMEDAGNIPSPKDFGRRSSGRYSPKLRLDSVFLLRPILLRHSQKQTYRNTSTTLMSLPPKTERNLVVQLSADDRREYDQLDATIREKYISLKASTSQIGTKALQLRRMLEPVQVACAGGNAPIPDVQPAAEDSDDEDDYDDANGRKKRNKTPKAYTEHVFTSKAKVLIEKLKALQEKDPSSKSLVFSQFPTTLKWLQQELPKHGFQFRTLSGDMPMKKRAKALQDFQNDPPTTIFLLSMRAGAVGINLTQANHVFILDPCYNRANELQAIGRVHRLGQKRRVEITRMVVENSIESRILEMLDRKYGKSSESAEESAGDNSDTPESAASMSLEDEYDLLFGVETDVVDTDLDAKMPDMPTSTHAATVATEPHLDRGGGDDEEYDSDSDDDSLLNTSFRI